MTTQNKARIIGAISGVLVGTLIVIDIFKDQSENDSKKHDS